jgi:hypothetical protein
MQEAYYIIIKFIWSGLQYGNVTFEDGLEVNIEEIRKLFENDREDNS